MTPTNFLIAVLAVIAVAGLAGWTYTNVRLSLSLLPMANALSVCQKIVDREDTKVASLAERVLRKREPQRPAEAPRRPDEAPPFNPMGVIFEGPSMPIDEQPDPDGLEIREA